MSVATLGLVGRAWRSGWRPLEYEVAWRDEDSKQNTTQTKMKEGRALARPYRYGSGSFPATGKVPSLSQGKQHGHAFRLLLACGSWDLGPYSHPPQSGRACAEHRLRRLHAGASEPGDTVEETELVA